MIRPPKLLTGDTPMAKALNQLIRFCQSIQVIESSEVAVNRSHVGTALFAKGGGGASSSIQGPFQIQSVEGDFITAFAYDLVNDVPLNTTPVTIAKEPKHWQSLDGENIFGVDHSYAYIPGATPPAGYSPADINNAFRQDTYNGIVDIQRITPPWVCSNTLTAVDGELIFAVAANTGVTDDEHNPVPLLIIGRSCQWTTIELPTS